MVWAERFQASTPAPLTPAYPAKSWLLAACVLLAATFAFLHPGIVLRREFNGFPADPFYKVALYRFHLLLVTAFLTMWLLEPTLRPLVARSRLRSAPSTTRAFAAAAVTVVALGAALFVVVFGRRQFGAFDFNILLEIGWRQILGQRPYVDFLTTSPPLFNLGIALAFRLFGVSWDAMLVFTALFCAGTLVWLYLLFRWLGMGRAAALGVATTIEIATMLSCSFWWYNNTTLLVAAIFFCCAVLLAQGDFSRFAQSSFVLSLALLLLAKPNIAGVTVLGCVVLLLLASQRRGRVALLTVGGGGLALLILFAAHISIPAMLSSYRGVAKERGALSTFGFDEFSVAEQTLTTLWYFALCLPLLVAVRPLLAALRAGNPRRAAFWFFFPLSALIGVYGLRGNGELRDVEAAVLVCALGLLAFAYRIDRLQLPRFTAALLCAMAASNLYTGIARHRVYTIGPHMFFEWRDRDHLLTEGRLRHMRVSETFVEVNDEVQRAVSANAGPFFFGPRLDYSYMLLALPSPLHLPAWWHPGTAFDRAKTPEILARWKAQRFPTLIFLKTRSTYYPPAFLDLLRTQYIRDDSYPRITVYRLRPVP